MSDEASISNGAAGVAGPLIVATGIDKNFYDVDREIQVLQDLSLTVESGDLIAVVGQSGTGKSTLLNILGSLERPTRGTVLFEGQDLFALDERGTADFRNHKLGFVFQFHYLLADFNALENVMMPALIARVSEREARERAERVLEMVGLKDKLHRRPAELSGGEQQRVAVARAVVQSPRLVLADEPTGNLDSRNGEAVMELLKELHKDGATICMVTHDPRFAKHADREVHLFDGKVVSEDELRKLTQEVEV